MAAAKKKLTIVELPVEQVFLDAGNVRVHSDAQVGQIAASIREFGFTNPVLVDTDNILIAGEGRLLAALELGMTKIPVIILSHLTPEQRRLYALADNKIQLNSTFDDEKLAAELAELSQAGLDLSLTGFDTAEVQQHLRLMGEQAPGEPDAGIPYKSSYGVIVMCEDEKQQISVFERLQAEGLTVKIVVT